MTTTTTRSSPPLPYPYKRAGEVTTAWQRFCHRHPCCTPGTTHSTLPSPQYPILPRWWTRSSYIRVFLPFFALINTWALLFCFIHHWIIYCHDALASAPYSRHFITLYESYLLLVIFAFFDISSPMVAFLIYLMQHHIWCRIPFVCLLFLV